MKRSTVIYLLLIFVAAGTWLTASCGGGSGGSWIRGTWYGPGENGLEEPGAYEITFDGDGNITRLAVDGIVSGLQGTSSAPYPDFLDLALSDNSTGGILVDGSLTHMAYFDENGIFAVLQKGATALPTYIGDDVIGA